MALHTYPNRKPPSRTLLTTKLLQALGPNQSVSDSTLIGLTVKSSAAGRKTYSLRYKKAEGGEGRLTIGYWPDLTPDQARERARLVKNGLLLKADDPLVRAAKIEQNLSTGKGNGAMLVKSFIEEHFKNYLLTETRCGAARIKDLYRAFPDFMDRPLAQITATLVLQWRTQALAGNLAPSTINRRIDTLRGMLSRAVEWNFLARHPLKGVGQLEEPEGRDRRLSPDEWERLENVLRARDLARRRARARYNAHQRARYLPGLPDLTNVAFAERLWAMVVLTRETGLRWRECSRLRWADIDLRSRILIVRKAHAKGKKKRYVPITAVGLAMLNGWREQTPGDWVFPNDAGTGPISSVRTAWRKALKKAAILNFRWHDLRHDYASRAAESGASVHAVSRWLGHANGTTTDGYIHYSPHFNAENLALLDAHNASVAPQPAQPSHDVAQTDDGRHHPIR